LKRPQVKRTVFMLKFLTKAQLKWLTFFAGAAVFLALAGIFPLAKIYGIYFPHYDEILNVEVPAGVFLAQQNQPISGIKVQAGHFKGLESLYSIVGYDLHKVRRNQQAVPRLFLQSVPENLSKMRNIAARKNLFVASVLPLILSANREIIKERQWLLKIKQKQNSGQNLLPDESHMLEDLADKYQADANVKMLLKKVDVLPVSLALAQAIEESGWGTSRFAQQGNALFGQQVFSEKASGFVPENRGRGKIHRVGKFSNLYASVKSYMKNLNTHFAYAGFRNQRAIARQNAEILDSISLANSLTSYSERRKDYAASLQVLILSNKLQALDTAQLQSSPKPVLRTAFAPL